MFPSNPLDKNCFGPDNCLSGRNNAPCRFPVGITSLGEENQHMRIQLAVTKYNNSSNNSLNNRCAVISSVKHSFLKNSLKAKDYDGETERTPKNEGKNGNQYEGVGAFPTIHLKRSAVRYRPIRRFNDVKIPYPELPVNRFLSHLSEVCPDLKSNTRSVLDVLEDLSGKKIHVKEDIVNNKAKLKGLGGDYFANSNAVYKPLFVQKPQISSVLTRDSTTQTLSLPDTEAPNLQSNDSFIENDPSDARTQLRRKLAKQNNEIFASLSSSISSSFAVKRKRDKILPAKEDENFTDMSTAKKSKISDGHLKNFKENGVSKFGSWSKTKSVDSIKLNRKNKLKETNSPTSPNKDRLMTIFLDMQNTNSKARVFNSNHSAIDMKSVENNLQIPTINGLKNVIETPNFIGSSGTKSVENEEDENSSKNSPSRGFIEKSVSLDSKKRESDQTSSPVFNFHMNKPDITAKDVLISSPATFQFGKSNNSNLNFSKTSEPLPAENTSNLSGISLNNSKDLNDKDKKDSNYLILGKSFISENPNDKSNISSFKFGKEGNTSSVLGVPPKVVKTPTSTATSVGISTTSSSNLQFDFKATTNATEFVTQTSTVKVDVTNAQDNFATTTKPFSFEKNSLPSQQPSETNKVEEKNEMSDRESPLVSVTSQSIQSNAFNFGQKSSMDLSGKSGRAQNVPSISSPTDPPNDISFSPSVSDVSANAVVSTKNKTLFTFVQRTETPMTSTSPVTAIPSFYFGRKSDSEQNTASGGFDRKNSNLFSFNQKSTSLESTQSTVAPTKVTPQSQAISTQPNSFIEQILPVTSTPPITFGQTVTPQITNDFGTKSKSDSLGNLPLPVFSQSNTTFPIKTPLFGSTNEFGNATTQASWLGFGTSATTQPTYTFGVSSASQTTPVFRTSTTSQSLPGFGNSSTTQCASAFVASTPSSTSTFGISVTTQPGLTFGVSSTTQSAPSFGTTSTAQSISTFGTSTASFGIASTTQSISGFGTSPTSQSTPSFGTSTPSSQTHGFGVSSSSQSNSLFGAPISASSALRFETTTTQSKSSFGASSGFSAASSTLPSADFGTPIVTSTSELGTTQPSFRQPFVNKPTSSLGQTANIFSPNLTSSFSSNTAFSSNQSNVFGQKPSTEGDIFDQNKTQTPMFGTATQAFGTQNKLPFGIPSSNLTGFNSSPPNTTAAPVFSFGSGTTENTFAFGSTSGSNNSQSPFAFKCPTNEPFKFGATTAKEGTAFGGTNTATFSFGGGQINSNVMTEPKSTFNFGTSQVSSSAPFNFGTTPSPSVFSFGGSTSSAGSGSSFSFGTPNLTPGGSFGQTSTPSPAAPFAVPGTFCIGSGSSQSRPRATSRPRRRP